MNVQAPNFKGRMRLQRLSQFGPLYSPLWDFEPWGFLGHWNLGISHSLQVPTPEKLQVRRLGNPREPVS